MSYFNLVLSCYLNLLLELITGFLLSSYLQTSPWDPSRTVSWHIFSLCPGATLPSLSGIGLTPVAQSMPPNPLLSLGLRACYRLTVHYTHIMGPLQLLVVTDPLPLSACPHILSTLFWHYMHSYPAFLF